MVGQKRLLVIPTNHSLPLANFMVTSLMHLFLPPKLVCSSCAITALVEILLFSSGKDSAILSVASFI